MFDLNLCLALKTRSFSDVQSSWRTPYSPHHSTSYMSAAQLEAFEDFFPLSLS